jgi:hypothetical protein
MREQTGLPWIQLCATYRTATKATEAASRRFAAGQGKQTHDSRQRRVAGANPALSAM